jgi:hypothetical protein
MLRPYEHVITVIPTYGKIVAHIVMPQKNRGAFGSPVSSLGRFAAGSELP